MRKLNRAGMAHWVLPVLAVLIIGVVGSRVLSSQVGNLAPKTAYALSKTNTGHLDQVNTITLGGSTLRQFAINQPLKEAYSVSAKFSVWSLSNPSSPQLLSSISPTPSEVAISSDGKYVYAISNKLVVYQTSTDPTSPLAQVGSASFQGSAPDNISVHGNNVFLNEQSSSTAQPKVEIFDVSNPASPTEVAQLSTGSDVLKSPTYAVAQSHFLYVNSNANATFNVFDIAKETNPKSVASVKLPIGKYNDSAANIAFYGNYAYVAGINSNAVSVIDISNPKAPQLVTSFTPPSQNTAYNNDPYGLIVRNDKLFMYNINGYNPSVISYDLSASPTNPTYVQTVAYSAVTPSGFDIYRNFLYVVTNVNNGPSTGTVYIYKIQ